MTTNRRIVIVGATSSIAEHCARLWAQQGNVSFVLIGRSQERLQAVGADLQARGRSASAETIATVLDDPSVIKVLVGRILAQGDVDVVLIAHGFLPDQAACQEDVELCHDALVMDGVSPVLFAEAFAGPMQRAGSGTIALIGSVAGDRGRKSNYVYGSAKRLMEGYAQGLQHRLARSGVNVVLVKPGPTDTPMTRHLKSTGGRLADVRKVARRIVEGIAAGKREVYTPGKWALIMLVIRNIPNRIFDRLDI